MSGEFDQYCSSCTVFKNCLGNVRNNISLEVYLNWRNFWQHRKDDLIIKKWEYNKSINPSLNTVLNGSSLEENGTQNLSGSFHFYESASKNGKCGYLKCPRESLWVNSVLLFVKEKFFWRTTLTLKDTAIFK